MNPYPPWICTALSARSEEHTSELQSQSNLVCRLLLEKKKKPHARFAWPQAPLKSNGHTGAHLASVIALVDDLDVVGRRVSGDRSIQQTTQRRMRTLTRDNYLSIY